MARAAAEHEHRGPPRRRRHGAAGRGRRHRPADRRADRPVLRRRPDAAARAAAGRDHRGADRPERDRRRDRGVRRGGARPRPRTSGARCSRSRACSTPTRGWCSSPAPTSSGCGFAQSAMGPFYCPNDQTVYLDIDFFRVMEQQLGSRGDFAKAYVIAHEVGHHVQDELGLLAQVNAQRSRAASASRTSSRSGSSCRPTATPGSGPTRRRTGCSSPTRTSRARSTPPRASATTRCSRRAGAGWCPTASPTARSEQRQRWFHRGFQTGDPDTCDTFSAAPASEAMANVVNLRTARKQRGRAEARRAGAKPPAADARRRRRGRAAAPEAERAPRRARRPPPRDEPGALSWPGRPEKHSLTLSGHRTTVSLEPEFWRAFRAIAAAEGRPLNDARRRDRRRPPRRPGLASAIRVHVLAWHQRRTG